MLEAGLCLAVVEILIQRETAVFPAQIALPENDGFPDNAGNGLPTLAFAGRMRSACELKRSSKLCAVLPHSTENYTNLAMGDFEAAQLSAWKRPVFPVDRAAEQQHAVFVREGPAARGDADGKTCCRRTAAGAVSGPHGMLETDGGIFLNAMNTCGKCHENADTPNFFKE